MTAKKFIASTAVVGKTDFSFFFEKIPLLDVAQFYMKELDCLLARKQQQFDILKEDNYYKHWF